MRLGYFAAVSRVDVGHGYSPPLFHHWTLSHRLPRCLTSPVPKGFGCSHCCASVQRESDRYQRVALSLRSASALSCLSYSPHAQVVGEKNTMVHYSAYLARYQGEGGVLLGLAWGLVRDLY